MSHTPARMSAQDIPWNSVRESPWSTVVSMWKNADHGTQACCHWTVKKVIDSHYLDSVRLLRCLLSLSRLWLAQAIPTISCYWCRLPMSESEHSQGFPICFGWETLTSWLRHSQGCSKALCHHKPLPIDDCGIVFDVSQSHLPRYCWRASSPQVVVSLDVAITLMYPVCLRMGVKVSCVLSSLVIIGSGAPVKVTILPW